MRRVPVVDENGRCVGIVAQADVALHAGERSIGQVVEEISRPTPAASRADPTAPLRG